MTGFLFLAKCDHPIVSPDSLAILGLDLLQQRHEVSPEMHLDNTDTTLQLTDKLAFDRSWGEYFKTLLCTDSKAALILVKSYVLYFFLSFCWSAFDH